jgi:glycosyltransferase involved in cell wall biosynthesis
LVGGVVSPNISIVIPTRNRRRLLLTAVRSVLAQELDDLEVIVVDDASDDGTLEAIGHVPDGRVRALRFSEPKGVARARNAGLDAARADWVAFLDDDDLWAPAKLRLQFDALCRSPEGRWSCVTAVRVDGSIRVIGIARAREGGDVVRRMLEVNAVPGGASGVLADRALVASAGGFDERLSVLADWDLWIRLSQLSPLVALDVPLLAYRVHADRMSTNVDASRRELETVSAKHSALRARLGAEVDCLVWDAYFAELEQRSGAHLAAARSYLRLARRHHKLRAPVLAALGALPGATTIRDRRRYRRIPEAELATISGWLAPLQGAAGPTNRSAISPDGDAADDGSQ